MADYRTDWSALLVKSFSEPQKSNTVPTLLGSASSFGTPERLTVPTLPAPYPSLSALASIRPPGPPSPLAAAISRIGAPASTQPQWVHVTARFDQLIEAIGIREDEIADGLKKAKRVVGSLNRAYYDDSSETDNGYLLGSWAKQTRVRPFSDLDLMFVLPWTEYHRFDKHIGKKQSNLLQEVRKNLTVTYPRTEIWGDRHVVAVEVDGMEIEVVPAFAFKNGQCWVCDTKDNGSYKLADPNAELLALNTATKHNQNARQLTRLSKKWQIENDVPIKAFQLERVAIEFMNGWQYSRYNRFWYDWMVRDFFVYLIGRANGSVQMPGTGEWIALGDAWLPAARRAHISACAACVSEQANLEVAAGKSWQELFGTAAPVRV